MFGRAAVVGALIDAGVSTGAQRVRSPSCRW